MSTKADICAFFHLREQGNRIEDIGGSMGTEKQEELLQIKNLAISFYNKSGEVQAVRGISYTLHKREVLGIV